MNYALHHPRMPSPVDHILGWPTRATEIARILNAIHLGRSVVVSSLPPDGAVHVAEAIAAELVPLGGTGRIVVADGTTQLSDLAPSATDTKPVGVIFGAHFLADTLAGPLEEWLASGSPQLVLFVDVDQFDGFTTSMAPGVMGLLSRLWSQDSIVRVDLGPLSADESRELARLCDPHSVLDELQLCTLSAVATRVPLLIADLIEDAASDPSHAPRRIPRPALDVTQFSQRTTLRAATMMRGLTPALATSAAAVATLGPLPISVAHQLLGAPTIDLLLSRRVAHRVDDQHERCVWVSTLFLAAISEHFEGRAERDHSVDRCRRALEHLRRSSGLTTDTTKVTLALLSQDSIEETQSGRSLAAEAAEVTAYWGESSETDALLKDAGERSATLQTRIRSELLHGRYQAALELTRKALGEAGGRADDGLSLFLSGAVACSWMPETPPWFAAALKTPNGAPDGAGFVLTQLIDGCPPSDSVRATCQELALDAQKHLAVRMLACQVWCRMARDSSAPDAVVEALTCAEQLLAQAVSRLGGRQERAIDEARLLLLLTSGVTRIATGIANGQLADEVRKLGQAAAELGHRSGWLKSTVALTLTAIVDVVAGRRHAAIVNARAAAFELRPALFASTYVTLCSLGVSVWPSSEHGMPPAPAMGALSVARDRLRESVSSPLDELTRSSNVPLPSTAPPLAWLAALRLCVATVDGEISAAEALEALPRASCVYPTTQRIRQFLAAVEREDADELVAVAEALAASGLTSAALHSLTLARSLFLGTRSHAKALQCTQRLDELEGHFPWSEAPPPSTKEQRARLSARELEVAQLAAAGLSNTSIARKLFLSVRTVESHVLKARAKLGATSRQDLAVALEQFGIPNA